MAIRNAKIVPGCVARRTRGTIPCPARPFVGSEAFDHDLALRGSRLDGRMGAAQVRGIDRTQHLGHRGADAARVDLACHGVGVLRMTWATGLKNAVLQSESAD